MKVSTSPGLDGLTLSWYRQFSYKIGYLLVKLFNESFDNGAITPSQQISILTLIHKTGDKFKFQNYRPICLTNCDYRILASTLANRLHQILHIMISTDQSGYVKGRFYDITYEL